jgi:nanoRNase/pAp phosphatase (c-di-AMP/oligoRNAs hydrolase)
MNTNAGNSSVFCDKIKDYDFVVVWSYSAGVYYYSIYSHSEGADCEAIARKFGGGGHARAAGVTFNENSESAKAKLLEELVKLV